MSTDYQTVPECFASFEEARHLYLKVLKECQEATPPRVVPLDLTQALFSRAALVMISYHHPHNWPNGGTDPIHPFPRSLSGMMADFTRYFIAGKVPGPIKDLLRRGTPANGPEELRAQGLAVAYHMAALAGVIVDRHPTVTVSEAFDVKPRTVQRWSKEQAAAGVTWRDMVPDSFSDAEAADFLGREMRQAAEQYLKKGRLATPRTRGDSK